MTPVYRLRFSSVFVGLIFVLLAGQAEAITISVAEVDNAKKIGGFRVATSPLRLRAALRRSSQAPQIATCALPGGLLVLPTQSATKSAKDWCASQSANERSGMLKRSAEVSQVPTAPPDVWRA